MPKPISRRIGLMLGNLKLGRKITVSLLLIVFVTGIIFSSVVRANFPKQSLPKTELNQQERNEIASKSLILLETMNAVRNYTILQVTRKLPSQLAEKSFLKQAQPSYAAREIFDVLRRRENYRDYFYKEATLNPTNLLAG
jgi:hypothetical protein